MQLQTVDLDTYFRYFPRPRTPYGSEGFVRLVAANADRVEAVVMLDTKQKARLGLVAGRRGDGEWRAPWSAPFTEVAYNRPQTLETCVEFARMLAERFGRLRVTLPPSVYDPAMQPVLEGAFSTMPGGGWRDWNYHVELMRADNVNQLSANARNHCNRALRAGFEFDPDCALDRAYAVIAANRARRGYPLAMSLEALHRTAEAGVRIHSMVLTLDGVDVASAIVYRIDDRRAQLIYWGDVGGYERERPMNLLAVRVYDAAAVLGYELLDLGPSSSEGVPDLGLCTFKESVGGRLTFKPVIYNCTVC